MTERKGDWISTSMGQMFWPLDPRPEDVHIEDIAHALSHICRWGGHCRAFYSVAQHCVHVAEYILRKGYGSRLALMGLLHDASEAYIGDMVTPVKRSMPDFYAAEQTLERAIYTKFGLHKGMDKKFEMPGIVVEADQVLLVTEKRDLTNQRTAHLWDVPQNPLPNVIDPWSSTDARNNFILSFKELWNASFSPTGT